MSCALRELDAVIRSRLASGSGESYTVSLARMGQAKCAQKFGEEAVEAVIAATQDDPRALRNEAADVLYHLLVLLEVSGVTLEDVLTELRRRSGVSGLEEKASRTT